jgi:hypothetical protein
MLACRVLVVIVAEQVPTRPVERSGITRDRERHSLATESAFLP